MYTPNMYTYTNTSNRPNILKRKPQNIIKQGGMGVCLASTYCINLGFIRKTEATQVFKCERLYCRKLKG